MSKHRQGRYSSSVCHPRKKAIEDQVFKFCTGCVKPPESTMSLGRFHLRHRQPRTGRNPRTGEPVQMPAKAVPTFAAGTAFQDRVQSNAAPA
jgi:nucleoid DNA-binding protein